MFAFFPALSIGIAVSAIAAQNIGARNTQRVNETLKKAILLSLVFSSLIYVFVNLFTRNLVSIFTDSSVVIMVGVEYLRIVSCSYLFFPFIFPLQGIIRACGDTLFLALFTLISMFLIRLPLAYFLAEHTTLKELGIWIGIVSSAFIGISLNFGYYLSGRWRNRAIVERGG